MYVQPDVQITVWHDFKQVKDLEAAVVWLSLG